MEEAIFVEVRGREFEVFYDSAPDSASEGICPVCGNGRVPYKYVVAQIFEVDVGVEVEDDTALYAEIITEALEQLGDAYSVCDHCEDEERGELYEGDFC